MSRRPDGRRLLFMNSFQSAIADSIDAIRDIAAVDVTYHRGDDWLTLSAVPGESRFTLTDNRGRILKAQTRDYLIKATDLIIDGAIVEPQRGDQIKEDRDRDIAVYEVMRPDAGNEVWRYSDAGRTTIRIHTRLTGTEGKV